MNAFLRALSLTALFAAAFDCLLPPGETGDTGRMTAGLCVTAVVLRGIAAILRLDFIP